MDSLQNIVQPQLQLPPPLYPLTENNLRAHTQQTNLSEEPIRIMSDTATTTTKARKNYDTRARFERYGVVLDCEQAFPPLLQCHIENIMYTKRKDIGSPSVRIMTGKAKQLQLLESELKVMSIFYPHLMSWDATERDGEEYTFWDQEDLLAQGYVTRHEGKQTIMPSKPIADACNGYIRRAIAEDDPSYPECPFAEEEEEKLLQDPELPYTLLDALVPFLTA